MPPVETGKSPKDIVLTPLDGDNTHAAKELRKALKSVVEVKGKTATATLLNALAVANGFVA